jgi:signal transduction histidine kinase
VTVRDVPDIPPEVRIALYRIAQEALNNMAKHADASQVTMNLLGRSQAEKRNRKKNEYQKVKLQIYDDGCGFDLKKVAADHFGLGIMRERAQSIGAKLSIKSRPGCGTQINVLWQEME